MAKRLPPGPKLPSALQTLIWISRPVQFLRAARARYGDTFTMRISGMGNLVLTSRPELIKQIFSGDPEQLRAGEVNAIIGPVVGEHSVLLLDGARHLRHRRLLLPPFHGERMKLYGAVMQAITEADLERWPEDEPFALRAHTQRITLDVILRTVFGLDEGARLAELRGRLEQLLALADSPASVLGMMPAMRRDLPFLPWRRFLALRDQADRAIYAEIARRRETSDPGRNDVLSLLLEAVDEDGQKLDDVELRDELMTLLLAGHETTATAICWAFERILDTPRVHERIKEELARVVGRDRLAAEHLQKLDYLDAAIKEALRVRPVIPMVGRRLQSPFELGDWQIPRGWVLAPSIYLTHMNPDVYSNPEQFRPERFLETRPDAYAWLPFGGGIRRCLGMAFALYEMKVVMATMLTRADLELAQPAPVDVVRRSITFTPRGGTVIRARRRPVRAVA